MNRRSFIRALLATPVVAAIAPLLPAAAARPAIDLAARVRTAVELYGMAPIVSMHDITALLHANLISEASVLDYYGIPVVSASWMPKDTIWLYDESRIAIG